MCMAGGWQDIEGAVRVGDKKSKTAGETQQRSIIRR